MMANFENTNLLTKFKVKISLLKKENLDFRNHLTDKHLTIQKLKTSKVSITFKSTESPSTLTTITIAKNTEKNSEQLIPAEEFVKSIMCKVH